MINFVARLALGCYLASGVFIGIIVITGQNVAIPWWAVPLVFGAGWVVSFGIKPHARID